MKKSISLLFLICLFLIALSAFAQKNGTGLQMDDSRYKNAPLKATLLTRDYTALPANASLKKYCPTPGHQGIYSTCVGWSTAYAARTILEAKQSNITEKSDIDQMTFSGAYIYKLIKFADDNSCAYGTYIDDALTVMQNRGVPKFSEFNPLCPASVDISEDVHKVASDFKIKSFARIFEEGDTKIFKLQAMKKALSEGNPVVIGMLCPESFYTAKDFWQPAETESPLGQYGGHAMCVIGYDDKKYEDDGAFEVINSWGNSWGNEGFIWIKYSTYINYVKYGYEMIALPPSKTKVQDLSGAFKLLQPNDAEMKVKFISNNKGIGYYKMTKPYSSGTRFRIYISNNEPAFVYAIGTDLSNKVTQIFPNKPGISPALNYKSNNVAIPDETKFIRMDTNTGTDYLCVLYSKEPLDLTKINKQLETSSGNFLTRLQTVLAPYLVLPNNVRFNAGEIKFGASSEGKAVVAALVEIEHIE